MGDYVLVTTRRWPRPELPPQAGGRHQRRVVSLQGRLADAAPVGGDRCGGHPRRDGPRLAPRAAQVLGEPMTIPGVGDYVAFVDTEGNRNSVMLQARCT